LHLKNRYARAPLICCGREQKALRLSKKINKFSGLPCVGYLKETGGQFPVATSSTSSVAMRYAQSLFELALEAGAVEKVEASLGTFKALIDESGDLKRFIESPVLSADEQSAAIEAVLKKAKAEPLVANFLKVVARNRRLFAVPAMIDAFAAIAAEARGEASADVTSARELNATQTKQLQATLKEVAGKDVAINLTVDPSILGGLIVKMGSKQIDTSLKTKLSTLKLALKEVG